ncbi:hypothetical protein FB451DRAFT_1223647, partial [Mycena latifolia]
PLLCPVARLLVRVSALIPSHFYCHPAAPASNFALGAWLSRAHCPPLLVAHAHTRLSPRRPIYLPHDDFRTEDFED